LEKTLWTTKNQKLLVLLKQVRLEAGLRQWEIAAKISEPQSFVSKYELGERRLDLVELKMICAAIGIPIIEFIRRYEEIDKP
jgi:transcriptional regulator with XRE-family HTH domain